MRVDSLRWSYFDPLFSPEIRLTMERTSVYGRTLSIRMVELELTASRFAELFVGMVAACIPCLKALLERMFHAIGGQLTTVSKGSSQNQASRATAGDYDLRALPTSRSHHVKSAHMSDEISDDIPLARNSASELNQSESHETIPVDPTGIRKAVEFSWSEHRVGP